MGMSGLPSYAYIVIGVAIVLFVGQIIYKASGLLKHLRRGCSPRGTVFTSMTW